MNPWIPKSALDYPASSSNSRITSLPKTHFQTRCVCWIAHKTCRNRGDECPFRAYRAWPAGSFSVRTEIGPTHWREPVRSWSIVSNQRFLPFRQVRRCALISASLLRNAVQTHAWVFPQSSEFDCSRLMARLFCRPWTDAGFCYHPKKFWNRPRKQTTVSFPRSWRWTFQTRERSRSWYARTAGRPAHWQSARTLSTDATHPRIIPVSIVAGPTSETNPSKIVAIVTVIAVRFASSCAGRTHLAVSRVHHLLITSFTVFGAFRALIINTSSQCHELYSKISLVFCVLIGCMLQKFMICTQW